MSIRFNSITKCAKSRSTFQIRVKLSGRLLLWGLLKYGNISPKTWRGQKITGSAAPPEYKVPRAVRARNSADFTDFFLVCVHFFSARKSMQRQKRSKHGKVTLSSQLQEIIHQESPDAGVTLNEKLKHIQSKQCDAVEFYFRAVVQRLENLVS